MPDGGKDTNSLEDLFSETEGNWSRVLRNIEDLVTTTSDVAQLLTFLSLQRVRVPAARDAFEKYASDEVIAIAKQLSRQGKLPAPPKEYPDLINEIIAPVDPHISIHGMVAHLDYLAKNIIESVGYRVLRSPPDWPFLTSDNPVAYYNPNVPKGMVAPYEVDNEGSIELLFPLSPRLLLYGHTQDRKRYTEHGLGYCRLDDTKTVKRFNRTLCRFAYDLVFATHSTHDKIVRENSKFSPISKLEVIATPQDEFRSPTMVFGERKKLPKWTPR